MKKHNISKSWAGYPLWQQKKWANNYKNIREKELETSLSEDEAKHKAKELFEQGYVQVSRKYRLVAKGRDKKSHITLDLRTFEEFKKIENGEFAVNMVVFVIDESVKTMWNREKVPKNAFGIQSIRDDEYIISTVSSIKGGEYKYWKISDIKDGKIHFTDVRKWIAEVVVKLNPTNMDLTRALI